MLKAIIEKENVDGLLLFDAMAFGKAIFANAKCNPALQAMLHELDFVACASRTTIAAAQNSNALPFPRKCSASHKTIGVFPVPPTVKLPTLITLPRRCFCFTQPF